MVDFLIIARSGRALATSAKRAGYKVCVADYFVDEDTKIFSESDYQLNFSDNGFDEKNLLRHITNIISQFPKVKLIIGSGFESNFEILEKSKKLIPVLANSKKTVATLTNPEVFFEILNKHSIRYPQVFYSKPLTEKKYLIKKVGGIGGDHVNWSQQENIKEKSGYYFQKFISGVTSSVVFLADGRCATLVGFNRQLQSKEFADMPFLYQGAISLDLESVKERHVINNIVDILTKETGLKGLCGLDYILDKQGNVHVLEVNARPPASFELHDENQSLFDLHLACFAGKLPECIGQHSEKSKLNGYAILYAKEKIMISDRIKWPYWVKDIPKAGNVIEEKDPVCTVHAKDISLDKVKGMLFNRLLQIESKIAATQNAA